MAAKFRVGLALLVGALVSGAAPAFAQDAATNTSAGTGEAVGPRDLQDFNLQGTVTKPAEPQPAPAQRPAPAPATPKPAPARTVAPTPGPAAPKPAPAAVEPSARGAAPAPAAKAPPRESTPRPAGPSLEMKLPPLSEAPTGAAGVAPDAVPGPPAALPRSGPSPAWLLAALAALAGAGAYWWFGRRRLAAAGSAQVDEFTLAAPRPAPAPPAPPAPTPPTAAQPEVPATPASIGIVSTRLRPWLEITLEPIGCVVTDDQVAIEVELTLFNSGNLPARSILLEAAIVNAGERQDQDLDHFFANPVGAGKRASSLPPLKKAVVRSTVAIQRKDAREYEVEGRKLFVPLIAVNALYTWPSGEGQSAAAYVVGRNTGGEKLAPFRLDRGAAAYQRVAAHPLPNGART